MKKMEIDKEKAAIIKCFQGIKHDFKIATKEEFNANKIIQEKLKGTGP